MHIENKLLRWVFSILAYLMFDRTRSLIFSLVFVLLSVIAEQQLGWVNFFSCSGAILTLSGLFLNIKHSLYFHLNISKISVYYMTSGAGVFGHEPSPEGMKRVDELLADEIYGTTFMVVGTLIWAYGNYLMPVIGKLF